MTIYIFSGVPASGKSSLAKAIADFLNVDLISKDIEQIELFEKYGFQSREEKLKLVKEANKIVEKKILQHIVSNCDVVLDQYIRDETFLREIKTQYVVKLFYIYIYADAKTICNRYNNRGIDERPLCMEVIDRYPYVKGESHVWPSMTVKRIKELLKDVKMPSCLDGYVEVDSTKLTREQVFEKVKALLERI